MVKYCLLSLFHDFFVRDFCLFLSNVERTHVLYFWQNAIRFELLYIKEIHLWTNWKEGGWKEEKKRTSSKWSQSSVSGSGFGWLCEKKVELSLTHLNWSSTLPFCTTHKQRWFCSCETKWDFYAKDIEDICNCIYSEPSPLCDFYLASCDISPYGRSTRGKMVDYSSQLTLNPFHSNDLIWRIFLSFSFERKR